MIKKTLIGVGLITAIGVFGDVQAAGLDDFDQPDYDNKMMCLNTDHNQWVVVARTDDSVTVWEKGRPDPSITMDIIDRDESKGEYVTRQKHMFGENINLYDFQDLQWRSKTPMGRVSYDCR